MDVKQELERVAAQEAALMCEPVGAEAAWRLGALLREAALERGAGLAIEVRLGGNTVFFASMAGATPANADWARRKRNTVELLARSSYAAGLALSLEGSTLQDKMGLPLRDYASHGGSFALRSRSGLLWGAVTVSGLPQRDDHELVVAILTRWLREEPA
ncbi:MAG: heme-degrading domain-containing protein [Betaproteobacteria bacterium]|nr:heme-degrading domain-containing protein [Betaproteobacteria bacterium]MDE2123066.1 heme-degrading domain-containing protein [Betaproteobacteria bacterium]MDE2325643.1 heme-degrading domain-containing protein [Betaproteobacteria bacterium]